MGLTTAQKDDLKEWIEYTDSGVDAEAVCMQLCGQFDFVYEGSSLHLQILEELKAYRDA